MIESKKWEVSAEVTLFDDAENRNKLDYADKMEIMMSDERNEPANGQLKLDELENFLEFGKKYKFTTTVEELP
jgi:hypothetical protein